MAGMHPNTLLSLVNSSHERCGKSNDEIAYRHFYFCFSMPFAIASYV
jgi:hypothetical protein